MNRLEYVKKEAKKTENALKKLFQETSENVMTENSERGLSDYEFFADVHKNETDDIYGTEQKITRTLKNGREISVWTSNVWVNSNVIPESIRSEVRDDRFPVKTVSYWYTPYCYMFKLSCDDLYEQSEKEKILYEDTEVKVSIIRRNSIPFFNSVQYCSQMSEPEYVFYIKRRRDDNKINQKIEQVNERLKELVGKENSAEKEKLIKKRRDLYNELLYWHECVHADKFNDLFTKAQKYFNDWHY